MSEPTGAATVPTASFGSARWYWVALTVATIALVGFAAQCGQQFRGHYRHPILTGQAGSTIVYTQYGTGGTVTTWDWETNVRREICKSDRIGSLGAVARDGSSVAILGGRGRSLLICDLQAPFKHRLVELPPTKGVTHGSPLGLVQQGRYVVFWDMYDESGPPERTKNIVRVVDAKNGSLIDEQIFWDRVLTPINDDETFQLIQYDEDSRGWHERETSPWGVTETGRLERLGEPKVESWEHRWASRKNDGTLHLIRSDELATNQLARSYSCRRVHATPQGAVWLVNEIDGRGRRIGPRAIMDQATGRLTPLDPVYLLDKAYDDGGFVQSEALKLAGVPGKNAVMLYDRFGDVQVFDVTTGKSLGLDAPSRTMRMRLFGIGCCLALVTVLWLIAADQTKSLDGCVFSLTVAAALVQAALIATAFVVPKDSPFSGTLPSWQVVTLMAAGGSAAGSLVSIAWYWAWGEGLQPIRWCKGLAAWMAVLMPIQFVISRSYESLPESLEIVKTTGFLLVAGTYGVIGAGALALLLASPRLIGLQCGPLSMTPRESTRYQLGDLVVTMCGIGIVLAAVQLRVLELGLPGNQWVFFGSRESIVAVVTALVLVGVSLCTTALVRYSWLTASLAVLVVPVVVAIVVVREGFDILQTPLWSMGDYTPYFGNGVFLLAAWITSVIPLWMMHRKGWRWTRCVRAKQSESTVPAVA